MYALKSKPIHRAANSFEDARATAI
jgi:hypothetical protein